MNPPAPTAKHSPGLTADSPFTDFLPFVTFLNGSYQAARWGLFGYGSERMLVNAIRRKPGMTPAWVADHMAHPVDFSQVNRVND